jgi:hypothetical protein
MMLMWFAPPIPPVAVPIVSVVLIGALLLFRAVV